MREKAFVLFSLKYLYLYFFYRMKNCIISYHKVQFLSCNDIQIFDSR